MWDTVLYKTLFVLSGHLQSVPCIRWGGEGLIYSASQDRTIKVWRDEDVSVLVTLCYCQMTENNSVAFFFARDEEYCKRK